MSAYEIVQTIIGINLLIVSVVSACIVALKKDNKKQPSLNLVIAPKIWTNFGGLLPFDEIRWLFFKNNFIESPSFKLVVYFSKSKTEEKYYE